MPQRPAFRQKIQYFFDNFMARGTAALIGGLGFFTLVIILIAALVISVGGIRLAPEGSTSPLSFIEAAWESLMRTFDAGTMGGDAGWGFRLVMLFVTIGGIFVVSTLIGVLTAGVESKLEDLRRGRSKVLESGHTLILGWSAQIFTIVSELVIANENKKKACIVILADRDKVAMEADLAERLGTTGHTRVICRSGSPIDMSDIEIASPHSARSIIILPPETGDPDSHVIKTALALTNNPGRRGEPYHIVTQIREARNMEVIRMIGVKDRLLALQTGDLIARVLAQTSRQSGLSVVYTELMNYGGDEIYIQEQTALAGRSFGEALLEYEDSAVLGVRFADGRVSLNPPMDTLLAANDRIVAITADDDTLRPAALSSIPVVEAAIRKGTRRVKASPEKCLVLGWNTTTTTILKELDNYVPRGSKVLVMADPSVSDQAAGAADTLRRELGKMKNQKVDYRDGDTTDRGLLERIKAADYDHIIVLGYAGLEEQAADAKTLVTLLHLRDIAERDETPFSIVSEMLDLRNRELASVARVDDFIVSDHLISLMMAQLSEDADLHAVFADLFDPQGSEIYMKPASDYIETGRPVNFYTVVEAARRLGQVAFGYRLAHEAGEAQATFGVHTNPLKSGQVTFRPEDKIIVLAED